MTFLLKSFLLVTGVSALVAGRLVSAAEPPPPLLSYHAISDTQYRPKPALPTVGPAGSIINDPTFGCPILRLTDENTCGGISCITPAAAVQNTWNVDSTIFYVKNNAMATLIFRFDPKTMKATLLPALKVEIASFSSHDANIAWGVRGGVVFTYDFATGQSTDVLDIAAVAQVPVKRTGAFHVSANDVISVIFGGAQQDQDMYVLVYDTKTKTHHLWNTQEGTLDGNAIPDYPAKFLMHSGGGDESGRFFWAGSSGAMKLPQGFGNGPLIYDLEKGTVYQMHALSDGHRAMGFGDVINDIHKWIYRTLDQEGVNKPVDLMEHPKGEAYFHYDSHLSWNNDRPNMKVPVLASTYHEGGWADPKCVWGDEVVACATDGSGKIWRFAHHRSTVGTMGKPDYDFWDTPRGNVSQDGRFYMFTSDWENTLGKAKGGLPRDDVFIVKLESVLPNVERATAPTTQTTK